MCLRPIYVSIRPKVYQIDDFKGKSYQMPVPCGQCAQCLKKRQSNYRTRVLLNSQHFPYSYFVTLTYNEESVPIYQVAYEIDKESGEFVRHEDSTSSSILDRSLPIWSDVRGRLNNVVKGKSVRSYFEDLELPFETNLRIFYSDSLDYGDVQKFLKRLRSSLSYKLGDSVPKLSYLVCGEYGPATHRPHYHLLLQFDRPIEDFHVYVKSCWKLGFTDVKSITCTPQDFSRVGSYISKYLVKGRFNEERAALDGFCVRPRVRSSVRFGSYVTASQIKYLRCYDMFGQYSMFDYKFTEDEKQKLFVEMSKRFHCLFSFASSPLPKSVLKRLFAVRTPSGNDCWSPLYLEFRNFTRDFAIARNDQAYRQYCSDFGYTENTLDSFIAFDRYKEGLAYISETKFAKDVASFYKRSKV